ncbi:hypothetical protein ACFCP7_10640 [Paenibacillus elgii]
MKMHTLSTHTAYEAVGNVIQALDQPLKEQIRHYVFGNKEDAEFMLRPLESRHGWMVNAPYIYMEFEFEYARFTFIQLCNVFELLHGVSVQFEFADELSKRVKEIVTKEITKIGDGNSEEKRNYS